MKYTTTEERSVVVVEEEEVECVERLRELVLMERDESGLSCPVDFEFLVKFVRARKFNVESAFQTLRRYYDMRRVYHSDFAGFHPCSLRHVFGCGVLTVLKHRDPFGRKILVVKTELWDASKVDVNELFLSALMLGEEMILSKETQEKGTVMVHDLKGLSLSHARQFTLKQIKKFIAAFQGSFPAKFKAIYVLNQPYIHNVLFAIAQPFLSKKFLSRVTLCGNSYEKLGESLPSSILPRNLGGQLSQEEAEDQELMERLYAKDQLYRDSLAHGYALN